MTREEAIIEAGIEYSIQNSPYCIGGDNFYEKARELNRNKSFEAGVIWADKNPKSPWISIDEDLPCNHEELMCSSFFTRTVLASSDGIDHEFAYMHKTVTDEWKWTSIRNIKYWMSIPKIPK